MKYPVGDGKGFARLCALCGWAYRKIVLEQAPVLHIAQTQAEALSD